MPMMTGPSVGPGMLLTVLMRWPALIVVLAIGGGAAIAYKEYGLPEQIHAISDSVPPEPAVTRSSMTAVKDSDDVKANAPVIDHLAVAVATAPSAPAATAEVTPSSERYIVKKGDTLAKIAGARSQSPTAQRALVQRMFTDNPSAFDEEDPNKLHAGAVLTIPSVK